MGHILMRSGSWEALQLDAHADIKSLHGTIVGNGARSGTFLLQPLCKQVTPSEHVRERGTEPAEPVVFFPKSATSLICAPSTSHNELTYDSASEKGRPCLENTRARNLLQFEIERELTAGFLQLPPERANLVSEAPCSEACGSF